MLLELGVRVEPGREREKAKKSKVPQMYKPGTLKLTHLLSVVIRMLFCETW